MSEGRILTRRELYDLVWSKPMSQLAEEFGASDVGLKKICHRHKVPTPTRGWWAKKAAGKHVRTEILPSLRESDADLDQVGIGRTPPLPGPVRIVKERQRAERLTTPRPRRRAIEAIASEPVVDVHPVVRKTAVALRRAKTGDDSASAGGEGVPTIEVGTGSVERLIHVLDDLARSLDRRGLPMTATEGGWKISAGMESATFRLKERSKWVPHVPTESELARKERNRIQLEKHWQNPNRYSRPPYGPSFPEQDRIWTGELTLEIEGYSEGSRRKWADGRTQRLEALVPSIVDGIEILLASRQVRREEQEERSRQWAAWEKRRALAKKRQEREAARVALLEELAQIAERASRLRLWLGRQETNPPEPDSDLDRMVDWSRALVLSLEDKLESTGLQALLVERRLFPAQGDDELHDPLGEPKSGHLW